MLWTQGLGRKDNLIFLFCPKSVLKQPLNHRNKKLDKIVIRLDKKRFLERNESAFMIPKKFEYLPIRRDETELVQKPVLEVHFSLVHSSHIFSFLTPFSGPSFLIGLEWLVKSMAGLHDSFSNFTIPSQFSHLLFKLPALPLRPWS